jgi:hypothetical protein
MSERLAFDPLGTYAVSFELAGFKRLVFDSALIQAGFNADDQWQAGLVECPEDDDGHKR